MKPKTPEDEDWRVAEMALAAAQKMPGGPERINALRQAGRLRFEADRRRRVREATSDGAGSSSAQT